MIRWIILLAAFLLIEFYSFQVIKTVLTANWMLVLYKTLNVLLIGFIVFSFAKFDRSTGQTKQTLFVIGLLLLIYLPKLVLTMVLLGEDLLRLLAWAYDYFTNSINGKTHFPARRKFISQIGLGLAAVPFLSLIYGIFEGKYNYKVIKQKLFFPDLPDAFDGMTITHISDIHSGSFDNPEKIEYAIDLINQQKSDIILFTGDLVNTFATEMNPWIEVFKKIENPKYGKYSVLGNHDYGEYVTWDSEELKQANFEAVKDLHRKIDFKLLLNEHVFIEAEGDKIAIVGVENWGTHFKKKGDLGKASEGLEKEDFKVLMSHDPSHWDAEIQHHDKHFHLTLSGHTHGMQFGIEIPGYIKWSLAQYIYKQWAGLYENMGRYIYVNRGFGFHAYPGRVGIWPEITVLKLKKADKLV
ncbi:MAG: metallophosphoesterase [Flavobacterium sp.]